MNGISLGVLACLTSSLTDFYLGLTSKDDDPVAISLRLQLVSIPVALIATIPFLPLHFTLQDVVYAAIAGTVQVFAVRLFLRGLAEGVMGVVSAISTVVQACSLI